MARNKVLWAVGGAIIVCLLIGGITFFWQARSIPPISEQVPQNYSHLYVQIAYPLPRSSWPLNSFIPIQVEAQAEEEITQIQLFINDIPLEPQNASSTNFSGAWMWQPGVAGDFIVVAKAVTGSGKTSLSEPLRITAIEEGFTISPIKVQGGETLESIAQEKGISLEQVEQSNPGVDLKLPLQPSQQIFLPNPPAPVVDTGVQFIPALSIDVIPEENGVPPMPDDSPPPEESSKPKTNFWDNFKFWLELKGTEDGTEDDPKYPPNTPKLEGDFKNCDVELRILGSFTDPSDPLAVKMQEDGFFVYRSRDSGATERIFTIPPVHKVADIKNLNFTDPDQYGTLVYSVSAFNVLGEATSDPVTIVLDPGLCSAPSRAGANEISMENGDLILPLHMDTAYLYLQTNGAQAVRIPGGDRTFLPGSGIRFNIYDYLDSLIYQLQEPDLDLHMEVWGWQGGKLTFAGEFNTTIHRSVITICSIEGIGSCTNGNGEWMGWLTLPEDRPLKDLKYEVHWQTTNMTTADSIYIQLAAAPFTGNGFSGTSNLLYAWDMDADDKTEGVFELWLGHILYPDPPNTDLGWGKPSTAPLDYTTNGFLGEPVGKPFTLYLRMQPHLEMSGYSHTSNIVPLVYKNSLPPPGDLPPLASEFSSMYDVQILEDQYKPPDFYVPAMWGCVVIDEDPTGQYAAGQIVCPGKMPPHDDCEDTPITLCLLEGMANSLGFLYDQFAFAYETYKSIIITGLQDLIPECNNSGVCKDAIHKGVDYGASYVTGLPEDMPKSEELIADTIAKTIVESAAEAEKSYTGEDISAIELFCDHVVDCEEEISNYIEVELKKAKSLASQPACINGYEAYFHGQQPACLDPSILLHPAPGSDDYAAAIVVRVTRRNTPEALAGERSNEDKYSIVVSVDGETFDQASQTTLTGSLYEQGQISIPWLEPGESIDLPVPLALLGKDAYETRILYFNGISHMKAVESCYSSNSTWDWVPCEGGGLDTWDFENPKMLEAVEP